MNIVQKLDELHLWARQNRWLNYFTIFCRLSLAAGFILAGFVKVNGERFTNLSNNQPMGHYLEALFHTGYYYTFIGILQMLAGVLLIFRRTATLGALLYFPIILNILILSLSVRFEGSLLSAPLMTLANLYLLCWDYDKLKYIMPYYSIPKPAVTDKKFPFKFFAGSVATIVIIIFIITHIYNIMPRNTEKDCKRQCKNNKNPHACEVFCDAIHSQGKPFDQSLEAYDRAVKGE